jgi:archaemetzincin
LRRSGATVAEASSGERASSRLWRVPEREDGCLLGLIDADCYAPGFNFVFGQASEETGVAFVALPRLRQSLHGLTEDEGLLRERTLKEAIHELGHTWGLEHCPNTGCVMHFSNSLIDTDRKGAAFCGLCAELLRAGNG